jgi:hypothetical protein
LLDEIAAWDRTADIQAVVATTARRLAALLGKARVSLSLRPLADRETAQVSVGETCAGRPRLVFSRRLAAGKVTYGMLEAEIIEPGTDLTSSLTLLDAVAGRLALYAEQVHRSSALAA